MVTIDSSEEELGNGTKEKYKIKINRNIKNVPNEFKCKYFAKDHYFIFNLVILRTIQE